MGCRHGLAIGHNIAKQERHSDEFWLKEPRLSEKAKKWYAFIPLIAAPVERAGSLKAVRENRSVLSLSSM